MEHRVVGLKEHALAHAESPVTLSQPVTQTTDRETWRARRLQMEVDRVKSTPDGLLRHREWRLFKEMVAVFGVALRFCGLYHLG